MNAAKCTAIVINRIGTLRRVTVKVLEDMGFTNILECGNVYEAQEMLEGRKGDLIIIMEFGINPPARDEFIFLKRHSHPSVRHNTQIVVTTQKATTNFVMDMVRMGISKVLIKSYDLEKFADRLDYSIEREPGLPPSASTLQSLVCEAGVIGLNPIDL